MKPKTKICPHCGKTFKLLLKNNWCKKYCSSNCQLEAKKIRLVYKITGGSDGESKPSDTTSQ